MLFVDGPKWSVFGDACVGKDDIELALIPFDLFEQPIQIPELRHIPLYSRDIGPNLFHRLIKFQLRPAGDKDVGTLLHEAFRRSQANAAVTARDQCNFSVKLSHEVLPEICAAHCRCDHPPVGCIEM